jgi:hypothetical protein
MVGLWHGGTVGRDGELFTAIWTADDVRRRIPLIAPLPAAMSHSCTRNESRIALIHIHHLFWVMGVEQHYRCR